MAGNKLFVLNDLRKPRHDILASIGARSTALCACVVLLSLFIAFGDLSWQWGAAGLIGSGLVAALWPDARVVDRPSAPLPAGRAQDLETLNVVTPLWRQMLAAIADAALVLDRGHRVIGANSSAAAMVSAADGLHIAQVYRSPELLAAVERASSSGQPQVFDLHMIVPVERHLAGVVTPFTLELSLPSQPAFLLVLRDRTEAQQLAEMRADFVANASHELRTPLASIKGFVETLQGAAKDDPVARKKFLGIMQTEAARMSRLIDELLSLSRIEMHEHVAPAGQVDLSSVLSEAVAELGPIAKAADVTLALPASMSVAAVIGDRDELMQVTQNLIQNAIKYGRRGGRVDLALNREGTQVVLTVADNGIGIAPVHLPRLTERFYRVSAKESRERGGTGLGLAIVKHIVSRHRGELTIASEPGVGSTFTVRLPGASIS